MKSKVIAIVGATASGKSSLGILVAKEFDGEIISVDSRQVYKGMDVGTAKEDFDRTEDEIEKGGSVEQLFGSRKHFTAEGVEHWGIDIVNPDDDYSAAEFKEYAEKKIEEILKRGKVPVLVGGTGFWLKAILENFDLANTPADPKLRAELESLRVGDLFHEYKQLDPVGAELIESKNKRKLVRALEVAKLTGKPFSDQQTKGESKYNVLQIGLRIDRDVLYERINDRVEEMVAKGLVDEVRALKDKYGCEIESMTGIGYRQVCEFLNGESSLKDAIETIKRDTRHYAKRQMTWFKRDDSIKWIEDSSEVFGLIQKFLSN
jgi:tRNA dimethylallyltransferase